MEPEKQDVISCARIVQVFGWYRRFGGGDGGNEAVNGSINPFGLFQIFLILGIIGQRLVDFGIGEGRVAAAAIACNADSAFGFDLASNFGYAWLFSAVLDSMAKEWPEIDDVLGRGAWYETNIDTVVECSLFLVDFPLMFFYLPAHICSVGPVLPHKGFRILGWHATDNPK